MEREPRRDEPEQKENLARYLRDIEGEARTKELELSETDLVNLLSIDKLLEALCLAGSITAKTGHETAFSLFVSPDKETSLGKITEGGTTETAPTYEKVILPAGRELQDQPAHSMGFHFHPEAEGAIMPSRTDLTNPESLKGICRIRNNADIDIRLVKNGRPMSEEEIEENAECFSDEVFGEFTDVELQLYGNRVDPRISELLKRHGFDTCVISYKKNKEGYRLTKSSVIKIKKFGKIKLKI